MHIHSNASTNRNQRSLIAGSSRSCRSLAKELQVSATTVHRWKHRDSSQDRSSRPVNSRRAISEECEVAALALRARGLTLDECLVSLEPLWPDLKRSTLHRFFVRSGVGRLKKPEQREHGSFKDYEPGFVHIDVTYLPRIGAVKRFLFVAIDRATRMANLAVYERRTAAAAVDFLRRTQAFFPFRITKVLTDNGVEFTNRFYARRKSGPKRIHLFDQECSAQGISHRLTNLRSPATNGMVERLNGLIKRATVDRITYDSHQQMEQAILAWAKLYNYTRPHSGIKRKTPAAQCLEWYKLKPELFTREPALEPSARSQPIGT